MDMTLEERIAASNSGRRNTGRRDGSRGGVRKNRSRPQRSRSERDIERTADSGFDKGGVWTHDRWEPANEDYDDNIVEDDYNVQDTYNGYGQYDDDGDQFGRSWKDRRDNRPQHPGNKRDRGFKVSISNLHSDVGETDLKNVFSEPGGLRVARILWERDRSTGKAFAIYETYEQAQQAVKQFNTQLAKGQPIYVRHDDEYNAPKRPLEARITYPNRSASPAAPRPSVSRPAPAHIDRYVPDDRDRSRDRPRRQNDRGGQRGERRERGERGARGGGRGGRANRPTKTKEELDAEMDDYFKADSAEGAIDNNAAPPQTADNDIDMDI